MNILILIIGVVFILFFLFSFLYFILPSLSPVPFFPSNKKDLPLICKTALKIDKKSIIIDLGAGTGTIIFKTAHLAYQKKQDAQFLAVEIHPFLILIMHMRKIFHPNKKNIRIIHSDMLKLDYNKLIQDIHKQSSIIFYLYIGYRIIKPLQKKLVSIKRNITILSYMYDIPGWEKYIIRRKKGLHTLTVYERTIHHPFSTP